MSLIPTTKSLFFSGRPGDPRLGEVARAWAPEPQKSKVFDPYTLILLGAPDDLGVTRNRGRAGAAGGPDGIRSAFYKIAVPYDELFNTKIRLMDAGNIKIHPRNILHTHKSAEAAAKTCSSAGSLIALGGGHDFAAPHITGWAHSKPTKAKKDSAIGVINVDPHLDVRPREDQRPHSGTPFRDLMTSGVLHGQYFVEFGARDGRNARAHTQYCLEQGVRIQWFEDLRRKGSVVNQFASTLKTLTAKTQHVALTIDVDSCSECEGVSAAPVLGFSAWELCEFGFLAGQNPKVTFLELAEVAPALDTTGRSARIAAEIIFSFMKGRLAHARASSLHRKNLARR